MFLQELVTTAVSRKTADPSRPLSDYSPTFKKSRLGTLSGLLTRTLRRRLTDFQTALDRFVWPGTQSNSLTARLTQMDDGLEKGATATLHYGDDVHPGYRCFSRGLQAADPTLLEVGTYKTTLTLGQESETISFDVEEGDTNRDVLDAFAEQVNQSDLDVQAEIFSRTIANTRFDLSRTGTVLALSVNRRAAEDDLELRDSQGHFLLDMNFEPTDIPAFGPTSTEYDITSSSAYRPSTFDGNSFDPNAETTINPGNYSINYAIGGNADSFDLTVNDGDTWKEVLDHLTNDLNAAQGRFRMRTETVDVPYYDPNMSSVKSVERYRGSIEAVDPKLGWRLELSENDTGYTSEQAATPLLASLGLNGTAYPGSDGEITVNGEDMQAAGDFTLDRGRLTLSVDSMFGGDPKTLAVRDPETVLQNNLTEIVESYNDLSGLLRANSDVFAQDLLPRFADPYENNKDDLIQFGFRNGDKDSLTFSPTTFGTSFAADPDAGAALLADESRGLIPKWRDAVQTTLDQSDSSLVRSPGSIALLDSEFTKVLNNEYRALIMDLLG